jgi:hypothetical protein
MKRSEFIKTSALSALFAPSAFMALGKDIKQETNTKNLNILFCSTCGTKFTSSIHTSQDCIVCSNDRQYLPAKGQAWTKPEDLQNNYSNVIKEISENFYEIKTLPKFAIGQRAYLIITPNGNILWDCISLLNQSTIEFIKSKGGLKAIAISHPHYYSSMNDWADIFNCPIYIHKNDEEFIYTKGEHIQLWSGDEKELWNNMKIKLIGGHFPGSSIFLVPFLSKEGTILCGDTFYISPNKKHISVMYSYPNFIPVKISEIKRINQSMQNVNFDSLIGAFDNQSINADAKSILHTSFERYQ